MVCDKHVIAKDLLEKKKTNNMRLAREKKKENKRIPHGENTCQMKP